MTLWIVLGCLFLASVLLWALAWTEPPPPPERLVNRLWASRSLWRETKGPSAPL